MSVAAKLAGFAAVLVVAFGVAAVAGRAVGPDREGAAKERAEKGGAMGAHGGDAMADGGNAAGNGAGDTAAGGHGAADAATGGHG
ncbi:hypothetical protein OM076_31285, partial [Solirubrobacter ginsenosidimutans]